jgi:sulfate adenylyltransferase
LEGKKRDDLAEKARSLKRIKLNPREASDVDMISVGAFSPLTGFMGRSDYESVVNDMHLASGLPWTIPITLSVSADEAKGLSPGGDVALVDESGEPYAVLHLEEKYTYDKRREAERVYRTTDEAHPGVKALYEMEDVLLGGEVSVLKKRKLDPIFENYRLDPKELRDLFKEKGWKRIVGFQTRNPVHRAHEYLQKCAMEIVDGLLLHPLVGVTKEDDVPADVRMECYEVLLKGYYPGDRVVMAVLPASMRYAGPREAIFHAIVRKNYGCTHFIVGRDHAGVGNYYGTYDAHYIFDEFKTGELGITPLFFEHAFFCRKCYGMVSKKTCPHDSSHHVFLSGTKVREMLRAGEMPPPEFTRPEVAEVLIRGMKRNSQ